MTGFDESREYWLRQRSYQLLGHENPNPPVDRPPASDALRLVVEIARVILASDGQLPVEPE